VNAARIKNPAALFCGFWLGDSGFAEVYFGDRDFLRASSRSLLFAPCCFFCRLGKYPDAPEILPQRLTRNMNA
jgi:hypothetical protein